MKIPDTCKEVFPEELNSWMKEEKHFYLIDTLKIDNFSKKHLPGALNACIFEVTFMEQINLIAENKNVDIVLYGACGRTMDAVTAAGKLERNGYHHIYVLNGGIESWQSAGLPLEGEAVDQKLDPQTVVKLENRSYRVDTDLSLMEWRGRNPGTSHFGTIKIANGEMAVENGILQGGFEIDMDSLTSTNLEGDELQPVLEDHLKSDDFFFTRLFPRAKFTITKGIPVKEPFASIPNYEIEGTLELRGVKARQRFMATITKTDEHGLMAEAHFDINRTKWGIIYGSARFFEYLGMHLVFDLISFQVRIAAN